MNLWPASFTPELFAGLLLDQNCEHDVFRVWVGNKQELNQLAHAFENVYKCTVIYDEPSSITVCSPEADNLAV